MATFDFNGERSVGRAIGDLAANPVLALTRLSLLQLTRLSLLHLRRLLEIVAVHGRGAMRGILIGQTAYLAIDGRKRLETRRIFTGRWMT